MSSPPQTPAAPRADRPPSELTARRVAALGGVVGLVLATLLLLGGGRAVEDGVERPLAFRLRAQLGLDPKLDPKLKVFALDDEAVTALGAAELTLAKWAELLQTLGRSRPSAILVDETFVYPLGLAPETASTAMPEAQARAFVQSLKALPVPVVAKAHVGLSVSFADRLTGSTALQAMPAAYVRFGVSLTRLAQTSPGRRPPTWLPDRPEALVGPDRRLAAAFARVGHDRPPEAGRVAAFVDAGAGLLVPHWALYAAGEPRLEGSHLVVGDREIPLDSDGTLPVNLLSETACRQGTRSLAEVARAGLQGTAVSGIQPGDTVVVLPRLHAGATDRAKTGLGPLPPAFVRLAVVNSAVSGEFLRMAPGQVPLVLLACLAGAFLAALLPVRAKRLGPGPRRPLRRLARRVEASFTATGAAAVVGLAGFGLALFVLVGVLVPWATCAVGLAAAGALVRAEALRLAERRAALLRHDLDGILSPETLQGLAQGDLAQLEATEQVVTIMFVDIVGFSRAAEKQTPKEAFSSLKILIDLLRRAVHDHGGVVDRTMGDGMLCVFGYDFEKRGQSPHVHAEQAVRCAASIQHDNLKRMLKAARTGAAVFPLRIGLNTAGVYLGNLGDTERTDLTVIGNGVNFAQRLEAACDRHMAMIGASTRDLLAEHAEIGPMLRKRHIRVKHQEELAEAWELDPFFGDAQLLLDGDEAYRHVIGIERSDVRHPVPYPGLIRVATNYGDGEMINFSSDGFTIKLPEYYAKDVTITLRMDTVDGSLGERLEAASLASLLLEVRWARPAGDGFVHGCLVKNLSREQREAVIEQLRDAIQRYVAQERRIA